MILCVCVCVCVFLIFFYKSLCCGHLFELHEQVNAIQIGNHNYAFVEVYWL